MGRVRGGAWGVPGAHRGRQLGGDVVVPAGSLRVDDGADRGLSRPGGAGDGDLVPELEALVLLRCHVGGVQILHRPGARGDVVGLGVGGGIDDDDGGGGGLAAVGLGDGVDVDGVGGGLLDPVDGGDLLGLVGREPGAQAADGGRLDHEVGLERLVDLVGGRGLEGGGQRGAGAHQGHTHHEGAGGVGRAARVVDDIAHRQAAGGPQHPEGQAQHRHHWAGQGRGDDEQPQDRAARAQPHDEAALRQVRVHPRGGDRGRAGRQQQPAQDRAQHQGLLPGT